MDAVPEGPQAVAAFAKSGSSKVHTLNNGCWTNCESDKETVGGGGLYVLSCACPAGQSVISVACYSSDNTDIVMAATGFGLPDGGNTGTGWCDFKILSPFPVTEIFDAYVYCVI